MKLFRRIMPLACVFLVGTVWAGPVDINSATAESISEELSGIGLAKAQAIVEYREKHGPFKSADELVLVKGIGERTVDNNRKDIVVTPRKR